MNKLDDFTFLSLIVPCPQMYAEELHHGCVFKQALSDCSSNTCVNIGNIGNAVLLMRKPMPTCTATVSRSAAGFCSFCSLCSLCSARHATPLALPLIATNKCVSQNQQKAGSNLGLCATSHELTSVGSDPSDRKNVSAICQNFPIHDYLRITQYLDLPHWAHWDTEFFDASRV